MKVLLINGSPHKDGCVARALEEVEKALDKNGIEHLRVWIGNKPVGGCLACGACKKSGKCIQNDLVNEVGLLADSYDGFIFGSPTYYAGMNGNLKSFMDRLFYSHGKALRRKPAAMVVSSRRGGSTNVFDEGNKFFAINQMPIVTSSYWNEVHGQNAKEVEEDKEGLVTMAQLGDNMAYLLKALDLAKKEGLELEEESKVRTDFVHKG
jgi:multimeric flavodoxin WrbA